MTKKLLMILTVLAPMMLQAAYAWSPQGVSAPEPDSLALLGVGVAAGLAVKWLRRKGRN